MWVTAFDEVAEVILGFTVKKFSAFDDDGRKRVVGGVSGMKCYMTIEKRHGVYYGIYKLHRREHGTRRILLLNCNAKANIPSC